MNSVADGDNVARPANIQVRPCEGDEARIGHSMLVPTQRTIRGLHDKAETISL